ncbi:hypothetical protein MAPG_10830 [Magnaporthiopsis poae ATCC 64411]|uniref:Uncharacterized protein n=1 Tax=Magnaporthiopsis poae (strain ATCC 64411 / 73-15) TaxID=644358 RepID=A0A0C4EDM5_MAGP6|nr:hypothetical protein MAPG_10830 [Magnaporthiopsis poae ATCC 64411]
MGLSSPDLSQATAALSINTAENGEHGCAIEEDTSIIRPGPRCQSESCPRVPSLKPITTGERKKATRRPRATKPATDNNNGDDEGKGAEDVAPITTVAAAAAAKTEICGRTGRCDALTCNRLG